MNKPEEIKAGDKFVFASRVYQALADSYTNKWLPQTYSILTRSLREEKMLWLPDNEQIEIIERAGK